MPKPKKPLTVDTLTHYEATRRDAPTAKLEAAFATGLVRFAKLGCKTIHSHGDLSR